jgi:D-alanine-D-alanine ligase
MLDVLHLVGSPTSDFYANLSRLYASDCLEAVADPARCRAHIAYVTPDRRWRFPASLTPASIAAAESLPLAAALATVVERGIDVVVPQMFCLPGMTSYRGLFDALGIPYVGNTPDVMAIGADKAKAKALVAAAGVATPDWEVVRPGESPTLPPPSVVKPLDGDNSLGVTLVRRADEYPAALASALACSPAAIVETFVPLGREVRCGIIMREQDMLCLPLEEYAVDPVDKPIRDHADKIKTTDAGELGLVAKSTAYARIVEAGDPLSQTVFSAARKCHAALGCRDYSLFDFRIDPRGDAWFLEASLYWSFARQSVLTTMATAAGHGLPDLFFGALTAARDR